MKHPALTRVFAVILAILGVIFLATGVSGIGKNRKEQAEREAVEFRGLRTDTQGPEHGAHRT